MRLTALQSIIDCPIPTRGGSHILGGRRAHGTILSLERLLLLLDLTALCKLIREGRRELRNGVLGSGRSDLCNNVATHVGELDEFRAVQNLPYKSMISISCARGVALRRLGAVADATLRLAGGFNGPSPS